MTARLKLFKIFDTQTRKSVTNKQDVRYFVNKKRAKKARDEMNEGAKSETRYIISKGPGHWKNNV